MNLSEKVKSVIKDAAQKLTGPKRRAICLTAMPEKLNRNSAGAGKRSKRE
jgi:hypothetical protein